jgi:hypothetical protein
MTLIMYAFLDEGLSRKACMMRVIPEKHTWWGSFQKSIHDESHSRKAYTSCMLFWKDPHHVCFSGMTLIGYAFLEWPSSCMLFWKDPHHVCFSGMTLIMWGSFQKSIHDEGLSRKACMMRVIPEKHTYWESFQMYAFLEWPSSCMLFWNDPHHVCFSGKTLIMYAFLEWPSSCMLFWNDLHHVCISDSGLSRKAYIMRVIPEKHTWRGSFQKSIHDKGLSRKKCMMRVIPEKHTWIMYAFLEWPSSCMLYWNDLHHVCFSGMTLIMYAFLEWPSSCILFWKDPHLVCLSGMTLIMYACMMRVIPEKHT